MADAFPNLPVFACPRCGSDEIAESLRTKGSTALKSSVYAVGGVLVVTSVFTLCIVVGWYQLVIGLVLIAAGAFVPPSRIVGRRFRCGRCGERWDDYSRSISRA